MSMSDILAALLFLLVPLRQSKADRRMEKDTFALIIIIIIVIIIVIRFIFITVITINFIITIKFCILVVCSHVTKKGGVVI